MTEPLLESLLNHKIPLKFEPAPIAQRTLAFAMDLSLLVAITVFLLDVILLPSEFPHELQEIQQLMQNRSFYEQMQLADELSLEAVKMAYFAFNVFLLSFWAYFFLNELFMGGTSLGKKTFGLEILSIKTGEPPSIFESSFRAIIKALALMLLFPFLSAINYLPPFFNASKRTGHDFICKTIVVQSTKHATQKTKVSNY